MEDGEAEIGMRVAHNALAKRTRGIGYCYKHRPFDGARNHFGIAGTIVATDGVNSFGTQIVTVEWDDGCVDGMSPDWLCRAEWQTGGYTHGKRRTDIDPLGR